MGNSQTNRVRHIWILILFLPVILTVFSGCSRKQEARSTEAGKKLEFSDFDELSGKRIGVFPVYANAVKETIPTAELAYYEGSSVMNQALKSGKIDAYAEEYSIIKIMSRDDDGISWIPEPLDSFTIACIFPKNEKGEALRNEVNEFIQPLREDGTLDSMAAIWTGSDEELKIPPDYESLQPVNGTIHLAVNSESMPMVYIKDNRLAGFEVDLLTRFCKEKGYALDIDDMEFSAVLTAVQSGKYDVGASGLTFSKERAESVSFADAYFNTGVVLVVRTEGGSGGGGFFAGIARRFQITFIDEKRWVLFVQGIMVTLIISILSIIFGTAAGFGGYLLFRGGHRITKAVTSAVIRIVQGMPVLILLMVLYYIIFGRVDISGIVISVIGFTIVFGASVFSMLASGVESVDTGQTEGAYTLGLTDRQTLFGIILPQAMPGIVSSFKGEVVSLVKGTSVVGYIAVQDLTKMGDIVRSRTYDAFFSIISVAVLYFVLAALINLLVTKILSRINLGMRSRKNLLKGVKTLD